MDETFDKYTTSNHQNSKFIDPENFNEDLEEVNLYKLGKRS
jgi:hypothetical protein